MALSDRYGTARLCVPSTAVHSSHCCPHFPVNSSSGAWLLSVNEAGLPSHRADWSASRSLLLHDKVECRGWRVECRVFVHVPPLHFVAISPPRPAGTGRVAVWRLLVPCLCPCLVVVLFLSRTCTCRLLLPRLSGGMSLSEEYIRRSSVVVPSVSLCVGAAALTASSGENGMHAGNLCCQCNVCSARTPAPSVSSAARRRQMSDALRGQVHVWQSAETSSPHRSALLMSH